MRIIGKIVQFVRNWKLRTKLAVVFSFLLGVLAVLIYSYFPKQYENQAYNTIVTKAESIANMTAYSISPALYFEDLGGIEDAFNAAMQDANLEYLVLLDDSDRVVSSYNYDLAKLADYRHPSDRDRVSPACRTFNIARPVLHNDRRIGALYLGLSLRDLKSNIRRGRWFIAELSLAIFVAGVMIIMWISAIITDPLKNIVETVNFITKGDFNRRVNLKSRDEIGHLGHSFNQMLDKLSFAYQELEDLNRNLELRVEERTKELRREIDERKRAEQNLKASEEFNRGIVDNSPLGILYLNVEGEVIYENPVNSQMWGGRPGKESQVIGRRIQEIPEFKAAGADLIVKRVLSGEKLGGDEIEISAHPGITRILEIHAAPRYDLQDKISGAIIMFVDITGIKALEEQLLQAQKMESIGTLAGGIAHDFNNILTGIIGNAEMAMMNVDERPEAINYLKNVVKSANRAAELTAQLLAFGRRKMERPLPANLNFCIDEAVKFMQRTISPLVEINVQKEPNLKVVDADTGQIHQVLVNLIINASDAMPEGGQLWLRSQNVYIDQQYRASKTEVSPGDYVKLTVEDTGAGIKPEIIDRIFEPFFTTKEMGRGTGLGLAMVYGIVQGHNGWIEVESRLGEGAVIAIFLPVRSEVEPFRPIQPKEEPPTLKTAGAGELILLVDDEETVRDLGERILKINGYEILIARDGMEAVEIYRNHLREIALVILDLTMPRKSGRETLKELLELNAEVKVIVSSGFDKSGAVQELIDMGAREFLPKPFEINKFLNIVRENLDRID